MRGCAKVTRAADRCYKKPAMVVPPWLTLMVAGMVIAFGLYRLRMAFRSKEEDERARRRKGLDGLPRRRQAVFGILYLILGGILLADLLGVATNPFRLLMPDKSEPAPEAETETKIDDAVQVMPRPTPAPAPASEAPPSN